MKKLLDKFTDQQILARLFELYPNQKESGKGYRQTLKELRLLKPKKDPMLIRVYKYHDNFAEEDEDKDYVSVDGYKKGSTKYGYALDFTPFEIWLGMDVLKKSLDEFPELDIVTHCLWEMTFHGYSNKQIKKQSDKLLKIAGEYEKNFEKKKKSKEVNK